MSTSPTIFELIRDGERRAIDSYPTFWVKAKDLKRIVREIRESIPLTRATGEPYTRLDIESAVRQGRIRIGKTTLRLRE